MAMQDKVIVRRQLQSDLDEFDWGYKIPMINGLLKRIFENRNIKDVSKTQYPLNKLILPDQLKDGVKAAELIGQCIIGNKSVLILGDYDADGATAASLSLLCLREMGLKQVDYLVPSRFDYGYGLSSGIARVAIQQEPDLVVTVDNGITSLEGVALLKQQGIQVIITDHHLAGNVLPDADAIVNPNQPGCEFASKMLAGVGVMFYLLVLLRANLMAKNWFEKNQIAPPNMAKFLDLVALGTVADVVPLDYNNRILVAQGLARVRVGQCRPGIQALLEVADRQAETVTAADFGFAVAPRINAAGRLDDISTGIECLLSDNQSTAMELAVLLDEINAKRRSLEKKMAQQANRIVAAIQTRADKTPDATARLFGLCLYDKTWHQGMTGLVASRIKDRTNQPTIVFAPTKNGLLTGSARSINHLHIKDLLESLSIKNPGLILKFGGHAMAAGLTIEHENLDQFKSAYYQEVFDRLGDTGIDKKIWTDGSLEVSQLNLETAEILKYIGPWGNGFSEPLFDDQFKVLEQRVVGKFHLKLTLQPLDGDQVFDAIAFKVVAEDEIPPDFDVIHMAYELDVNEFRGQKRLQFISRYFEAVT